MVGCPVGHGVAADVFHEVVERHLSFVAECAVVVRVLVFPVADLLAVGREHTSNVVAFWRCGGVCLPYLRKGSISISRGKSALGFESDI